MKLEATVAVRLQASTLAEAGAILDDVLGRARERDDVEVEQVNLMTPGGATPVSLPATQLPREYPPGIPHAGIVDGRS